MSTSIKPSSTASSATAAVCTPTTLPQYTWAQSDYRGVPWAYAQNWELTESEPSSDPTVGIPQCEAVCETFPTCRSFRYEEHPPPLSGPQEPVVCSFFETPYNESAWISFGGPNPYVNGTYVYEASNWAPPAELLPNGGFENGCLDPWFDVLNAVQGGSGVTYEIVKGENPSTSPNYIQLSGIAVPASDNFIANRPVIIANQTYKFTGWVNGIPETGSKMQIEYGDNGIFFTSVATGKWETVEYTFTSQYTFPLYLYFYSGMNDDTMDWKFAGGKVELVSN
jgi:hypothetical protein